MAISVLCSDMYKPNNVEANDKQKEKNMKHEMEAGST